MKLNKLYLLLLLGIIGAVYGVSKIQLQSSDLFACCDEDTDPDCGPPPPGPGPNNGDSMSVQILG